MRRHNRAAAHNGIGGSAVWIETSVLKASSKCLGKFAVLPRECENVRMTAVEGREDQWWLQRQPSVEAVGGVAQDAAVAVTDRSRDASVNVLGRDIKGSSLRHAHLTLSQRGSLLFLHLLPRPTSH